MAELPFVDSFDHYATANILEKWTFPDSGTGTIGAVGRRGTNGLRLSTANNVSRTFSGEYQSLYAGVAYKTTAFANFILYFQNLLLSSFGTNGRIALTHVGDGRLQAQLNVSGVAQQLGPAVGPINLNEWFYIEFSANVVSLRSISYQIRINEELVLSDSFTLSPTTDIVNPAHRGWATVGFGTPGGGNFSDRDDFYCTNTGFYGDVEIIVIRPNGVGAHTDWTSDTGSANWQNTDDITPDGDTTTNSTGVVGNIDTYEMEDIPANVDIFAVQGLVSVRKNLSGSGAYKQRWRNQAGSEYQGNEQYPSETSYLYNIDGYELSPFTGLAWTTEEINTMQFGQERTV